MAQDTDAPEGDDGGSGPLAWWQRTLAGLVGVTMTGAGGYSVFKTSNQAGSATLLIFGCIFMISSLNGAQIQGLKLKDSDISWYKSKVRREYARAAEQEPPEEGRKILETLSSVDPQAARDPAVQRASGYVYARQVSEALHRIADPRNITEAFQGGPDYGVDMFLNMAPATVAVIVKSPFSGVLAYRDLESIVSKAVRSGYRTILVITNASQTARVLAWHEEIQKSYLVRLKVVRWIDQQDDEALLRALTDLARDIAGDDSGS